MIPAYVDSHGRTIHDIKIGDGVVFEKTVSEADVYLFSGITGDFSPNHINERYMSRTTYGQRIAQAAMIVGFTAGAAAKFGPEYGIHGVSAGYDGLRFIKPVFLGDTIRVTYAIAQIDLDKERVHAECHITNQDDELVAVGTHLLKVFPPESVI